MKLYAVRTKEDHMPVGFYWVPGISYLRAVVDGEVDPSACEFKIIDEPCEIIWSGSVTEWKMGGAHTVIDPEDPERFVRDRCSFGGAFFDFVCADGAVENWHDLDVRERSARAR